jgi:replicative DNA helicase
LEGEPLPSSFKAFEANKIIIRRSEVSMFAGAPGAGKSTLALALALKTNVPTLYISADTNAHTMAMRLASMISGKSQSDVEQKLNTDVGWTKAVLQKGSHIVWSFESSPTLEDIDEEVQAFEELWGCSPSLIVLDNLMDVATDGGEEFASMRAIMKELKFLARDTNAAIVVLHHTSEAVPGNPCQPRSAIQGKGIPTTCAYMHAWHRWHIDGRGISQESLRKSRCKRNAYDLVSIQPRVYVHRRHSRERVI